MPLHTGRQGCKVPPSLPLTVLPSYPSARAYQTHPGVPFTQVLLARESQFRAFLSEDIMSAALWWEYLHHGHRRIPQIRTLPCQKPVIEHLTARHSLYACYGMKSQNVNASLVPDTQPADSSERLPPRCTLTDPNPAFGTHSPRPAKASECQPLSSSGLGGALTVPAGASALAAL